MGFWTWIGRVVGIPDGPARTFGNGETVWSPAAGPVDWAVINMSGKLSVSRAQALSVPTVLRGRNLLCSIATLPLGLLDKDNRPQVNPLFEQFDRNVPNVVHLAMTVEDLLFDAVAWWRVTERGADGYPMHVKRIEPGRVTIDPPESEPPTRLPSGLQATGPKVRVDGEVVAFRDLIRFDSPNPGILAVARSAILRALRIDESAAMYASEPPPREFFSARDGLDPDDEGDIDQFLDDWRTARRERSTAYVPAWVERQDAGGLSPAELQLAEVQKNAGLAVANALGIDPEELGISTTSRTYANDVDRRRNKVNDVLSAYMTAITHRLIMGDVTKRGYVPFWDLNNYLKSNPTERVAYYKGMVDMGAMDAPEVRATEQLPPRSDISPPASDSGGGEGTVTPLPPRGVAASRRQAHGFDGTADDGPHQFTMTTPGAHQFTVDSEARTISGLAVPYGAIGMKYGMKFRFRPGSLQYSDVSRVKHFKDHMTPVGKHLSITETKAGPEVKLSVSKGPVGDELLQLADDGVYDGLSVGVDFSLNPEDGDIELMDDGVYDVLRADWRETSTTAMPSFDDARVTKVAASRTAGKETAMKCDKCQQVHANGVTECVTTAPPSNAPEGFTAEQVANFQKMAEFFGLDAKMPAAPAAGPSVVDPTQGPGRAEVKEPEPYRFDRRGNLLRGTHDFSADLIAAQQGDAAASERATAFVQRQFAIATGDVNELNPAQNRPEMYVDQRQYRYPLWDAINKGTLDSITPFFFPKFSSASGLVGDHTEGVEPTTGTFVTTNQTVTPTPVSGKAEINREVWDQGGSPQASNLIWQKMLQGWREALEAYAVTLLDGSTPTAITLTAGATNDALVDELTEELAMLQFIRGGYAFDTAFTQVDLYKALVAAKGTDGRKLLPALNPANADGQARTRWSGLDVNGQAFLPAWALAASGTVEASSYLFDPLSVHGWASTPQRLEFHVRVKSIDIGIWGYKAGAISDITGVREIKYDPVA